MKVMTILGTRPEIIRLSRVIPLLDRHFEHVLVFTGQNFDPNLSDRFFHELEVRSPDYCLECRADTSVGQIAAILTGCEAAISAERPERLLILGDTNSGLSAIVAKRKGVQVFHMEAGNRCYDDRVPEEVNRRIIDHSSNVLMPYTERSRQNLLREGIAGERIYVTGNPIYEVIRHFEPRIAESAALKDLGLETGRYFLVTMHREENVDIPPRLESLIRALAFLCEKYRVPVVVSTHPRTRKRMVEIGVSQDNPMIRFLQPFGFFDFIHLERNAFCVLSDSGTVQEECCIFKVPNVTLRDVTERPETVEVGSNVLSGVEPESILRCVDAVLSHGCNWDPPREYLVGNVSGTISNIIGGYLKF